mmetsp:Transcript_32494/g.81781  ORF Transcript_32494/g.81781 Transcript_32494/m.81781 type:complete len:396 (-) Transcript_32494:496-1683(-)
MAAAGNIVVGNPSFEDNPIKEFQDYVPPGQGIGASLPESTDPTKTRPKRCVCSRIALALGAGVVVIAAAAATAVVVGARFLQDQSDGNSAIGEPVPTIPGVSGLLVLRAASPSALVADGRFHLAIASAVASTLTSQSGGDVTADDVQVFLSTRPHATSPSLRGDGRRLEHDSIYVDYTLFLDGENVSEPEDAARILRATDSTAMAAKINAEMESQGFEQDMAVEVVRLTAEVLNGGEGGSELLDSDPALSTPDHPSDIEGQTAHPDLPDNSSSPFGNNTDHMNGVRDCQGRGTNHSDEGRDEGGGSGGRNGEGGGGGGRDGGGRGGGGRGGGDRDGRDGGGRQGCHDGEGRGGGGHGGGGQGGGGQHGGHNGGGDGGGGDGGGGQQGGHSSGSAR